MEKLNFVNSYKDELIGTKWAIKNPKAIIILVTGMAEHCNRYDHFATYLNDNGYSVYSLDHYGQGKNGSLGAPGRDYFFKMIETIKELSIKLRKEFNLPIYIFSHSMGSFVTQGVIERYSSYFDKIVLCGSNGKTFEFKLGNIVAHILVHKFNYDKEARLLAKLSIGAFEKKFISEGRNAWISKNKKNVEIYEADPLSGFNCTNGFYYEFFKGLASLHKKERLEKASKDLKVLIIGGDNDPVGNMGKGLIHLDEEYRSYGINAKLILYKGLRHEILNEEEKDDIYKDILSFYNE